jgi:hypothetical protein
MHALLAFVRTPETQKKKAPHKRRTRTEIYQQGFLKIVKFPSWHGEATRRHARTEPERPRVLGEPLSWNVCRKISKCPFSIY